MSALKVGHRLTAKKGLSMAPSTTLLPVATSPDAPVPFVVSAESVRVRAAALTSALETGAACLPPGSVERAEAVIAKAAARRSIAGGHTVVALAGATGSGKSSLFNALIGSDVAKAGVRRPTTSRPTAAVWGSESASALLDWLTVGPRHDVEAAADAGPGLQLDGLVLLDLPDFDSLEESHRHVVDRLLGLVDVFVWVTDPQKYADARLHEEYIAELSSHDAISIVVLNQADRLSMEALAACRSDLLRLLGTDGVFEADVIPTSAKDGSGVVNLRHRISQAVASRTAAIQRLDSDLRAAATTLGAAVAATEPHLEDQSDLQLVDALAHAAGIPVILDAVDRDFRRVTGARTGWLFNRLGRALRPARAKLLRLNEGASIHSGGISESDVRSVLGRSSLPPATPAARSAVDLAARELGELAGRGLPQPWGDAVVDAATSPGENLAKALDEAVLATSLRARNPLWWGTFGVLQWVFAIDAVVAVIWLGVVLVLDALKVEVDIQVLQQPSYPVLLLGTCLLTGFLLALLARAIGRVGAQRRKLLVAARLRETIAKVAKDCLMAPVQAVLDRHRETREHLEAARQKA